ncbi:hypothetical protein FTUN_8644 [Frigoriglobus tundricola]|uniref:Uncharacterized protein n=1 Tax=Frigoriglobus tundricola TaxID=2774151 RepID=A0A6M5Z4N2_9BACT|nr:hypothetical protein FTUN_8644 [Frigoriglobus tundricola]
MPSGKEVAQILGPLDPPGLEPSACAPHVTSLRPIARASSIFHPPRIR